MAEHPYRAHERLVAPARAHPQLWRLFAGLVLATAIAVAISRAVQTLLFALVPGLATDPLALVTGNTPATLLLLLASFGFVTVGVMLAARIVQKRPGRGLIGPLPLVIWQFWRSARALALLSVILFLLPPYDFGVSLTPNLEPGLWALLLPISLLAVLIQVSAEEILFRGYLQQSLAARFKSPLVWMLLPSILFAMGHYLPEEAGGNAGLIALWAGIFGCLTADLTARAGTLGPAIALHLFNNVTAILIVALPDSLSGLALYTVPFSMADTDALRGWLAVDFGMMIVSWLAVRLAIAR